MENHLDGLQEYGVTLTGSPEEPVPEKHSGRVVIGYDMKHSADAMRYPWQ